MNKLIRVSVAEQIVELLEDGKTAWRAPVSTAANGLGEEPDSYKTPRGKHCVVEKIGENEPVGTVFKGRKPTGEIWTGQEDERDLILTRILRLTGEEEYNRTTFDRYIYFHGTNHEDKIGSPASRGCIRLKNADMIALFELAESGMSVEII